MAIKLKENKMFNDPTGGNISTAIGKTNSLIHRDERMAEIVVKIWRDETAMLAKAKPIFVDRWEVRGEWYENYFNVDNTFTDNPSLLTAHVAYLVLHDYYEVRLDQEGNAEYVYRYGDWEPYII